MKLKFYSFLIIVLLLCSCGVKGNSNVIVQGKDTGNPELNKVINNYFQNFDDINKWSPYATDEFIKRVYLWCSGDLSESKSIEEMKSIYYEINKDSLRLNGYQIEEVKERSTDNIIIFVKREWENGQEDQTFYSFIKANQEWKVDDRF
ncbi:hypothetical protein ACFPPD_26915 [Cohnella suwonensis]|uniref:DUF4878 domain-containing protein n=1 Tax=Cohnella suwonensis TaxID=696072 RepID=A0ABW0M2G5_9BACL